MSHTVSVTDKLRELGFQDERGEFIARDCDVVLYEVDGEPQVDIILPESSERILDKELRRRLTAIARP